MAGTYSFTLLTPFCALYVNLLPYLVMIDIGLFLQILAAMQNPYNNTKQYFSK